MTPKDGWQSFRRNQPDGADAPFPDIALMPRNRSSSKRRGFSPFAGGPARLNADNRTPPGLPLSGDDCS
jgi:hypothetical protein